jgi:polyhydroxybutyrate depolymerase
MIERPTRVPTILSIIAVLLVASTIHAAGAQPSPGCRAGSLPAADGVTGDVDGRRYLLDAPAAPADEPLPLVIVFHGFRDDAAGIRRWTGFDALARREKFVAVFPDGHDGVRLLGTLGRGWDLGVAADVDRRFVGSLLDEIERERCIDRRRVYATGMSNGGFFASLLGCRLGDRFAAVGPVAGGMDLGACTPTRAMPIMLLYGTSDTIVAPDLPRAARDWWARENGCKGFAESDGCRRYDGCRAPVVACEGRQGHTWPIDASARLWRFFTTNPRD